VTTLFVDFDGVLHSSDAAFALFDIAGSSYATLRAAGLFEHTELLADALLPWPDVKVVVHSSWRRAQGLARLRELMGPIGHRVVGKTSAGLDREASVQTYMRRRRMSLGQVIILDDQAVLFDALRSRVIACDPVRGISEPEALEALNAALRGAL
jgi:hypothetical protein